MFLSAVAPASSSLKCTISIGTVQFYNTRGQLTEYSLLVDLYSQNYDTRLLSPAALQFRASEGNAEVLKSGSVLRQVRTTNGFADIVVVTPTSYEIRFYKPDALASKVNGFYTFKAGFNPIKTVVVCDASEGEAVKGISIVEIKDPAGIEPRTKTSRFTWTPQADGKVKHALETYDAPWTPGMAALRQESHLKRTLTENPLTWEEIDSVQERASGDASWVTTESAFCVRAEYKAQEPVTLKRISPCAADGSALAGSTVEEWTYETDRTKFAAFNKPLTYSRNDGYWERYSYSGDASTAMTLSRTVSPWLDSTPDQPDTMHRVTTRVEVKAAHGVESFDEQVLGQIVSRRWTERTVNAAHETVERSYVLVSDNPKTGRLTQVRTYFSNEPTEPALTRGRIKRVEDPVAKTVTEYAYASTAAGGRTETVTEKFGEPAIEVARTVTTTNAAGFVVSTVRTDSRSGVELSREEAIGFDAIGRPIKWAYNGDPADTREVILGDSSCCGNDKTIERDGRITETVYDATRRVKAEKNADGTQVLYTYGAITDAVDPLVGCSTVTRHLKGVGESAPSLFQSTEIRDQQGRTVKTLATNPSTETGTPYVATTYAYEVLPAGGTRTTQTNPDGSTEVAETYRDGQTRLVAGTAVAPSFHTYGPLSEKTYAGTSASADVEWTETLRNIEGQTVQVNQSIAKSATETAIASTVYTYDANGELKAVTNSDGQTRLSLPAASLPYGQSLSVVDLNGNRTFDAAVDRISGSITQIVSESPVGPARETRSFVYVDGATPHYVATQWQSVDGLRTASRQGGIDLIQMTSTESEVDRRDGAWEEQSWAQTAAGVQVEARSHRAYVNHRIMRSWATDATGAVVTENTYAYDAFNRVIQTTDGRGAVNSVTFGPAGQTLSQTTPDGTQSFAYDVMGRTITTTLPDGTQQFTCYTSQGQVSRQWGSQSYPVEYGYDVQGRTTDLWTWRKPVDAESGLTYPQAVNGLVADRTRWIFNLGRLVRKEYADGNGTDYSYTLGGKLATRTWARGIVTTYGYTPAGELALVDYADATPDVAYSYDRLGRQTQLTDGSGARTFAYDPNTLRPVSETLAMTGASAAVTLTRNQDAQGRYTGYVLNRGTESLTSATYTFDAAGRIATADNVTFGYEPHTSRVQTLTHALADGKTLVSQTAFDGNRSALASVAHTVKIPGQADTLVSRIAYTTNALGQRTGVERSGTAWGTTQNVSYGYDPLGQVTSAQSTIPAETAAYAYDSIGNRLTSTEGGTTASTYTANKLNQYTQIQGSHAQEPAYDADGNMTTLVNSTGEWAMIWNGENRLVEMTKPDQRLVFAYDYMGRRWKKEVYSGTPGNWTLQFSHRYLYDGYVQITELDALATHTPPGPIAGTPPSARPPVSSR